jgi:hydrogenase nickel incorporation protein HypA/HybF
MHELSLVKSMFTSMEEEFPGRIDNLRVIYLKVGVLMDIQPILMQNAFAAVLADEPRFAQASLHVEVMPIKIFCEDCQKDSEVIEYRFRCSRCGKPSTKIIQGEELFINKVEFEN